jgi:hypothetical protein
MSGAPGLSAFFAERREVCLTTRNGYPDRRHQADALAAGLIGLGQRAASQGGARTTWVACGSFGGLVSHAAPQEPRRQAGQYGHAEPPAHRSRRLAP